MEKRPNIFKPNINKKLSNNKVSYYSFLEEKVPWGLVPFVQALLYARFLRGDLDAYPPFLWK